jgi:hypothetical protein
LHLAEYLGLGFGEQVLPDRCDERPGLLPLSSVTRRATRIFFEL